jgi:hypothetical protein
MWDRIKHAGLYVVTFVWLALFTFLYVITGDPLGVALFAGLLVVLAAVGLRQYGLSVFSHPQ